MNSKKTKEFLVSAKNHKLFVLNTHLGELKPPQYSVLQVLPILDLYCTKRPQVRLKKSFPISSQESPP